MPRSFRLGIVPFGPSIGSASAILRRQNSDQDNSNNQDGSSDTGGSGAAENTISSNNSPNTTAIVSPSPLCSERHPLLAHTQVNQIIAVSIVGLVVLVCLFLVIRTLRARHPDPKYLPAPLKKVWQKWNVRSYPAKYKRTGDSDDDMSSHRIRMREAHDNLEDALHDALAQQQLARGSQPNANAATQDGVNRNTSVRSVMTLPVYRPKAAETEQVLGREGERDGIDTVVEMPTAEEDEAAREEEMDALYQIRVARRRQIAEREQRRQQRREARERRDYLTLHDVRERARIASEQAQREVEELREAHEAIKLSRQRAVSSVSYHDVGLVRADGTRLRANSGESERTGLLSDAASIAQSTQESHPLQHRRAPSSHSVLSIDTFQSAQGGTPRSGSPGHSRTSSRGQLGESLLPRTGSALSQRAGSSPELIDAAEADLGDADMPAHSPPGYEDVSLDEVTPAQSHQSGNSAAPSGRNSPYAEPPPDYPGSGEERQGPTQARQNRLSAQIADLVDQQRLSPEGQQGHSRTSSRGVGGIPQLPSLRLNRLPQIVIEPSSAVPRDDEIAEERR
ncbi:hypothetical protein VP1G_05950 [Cytospora mali]|uniref:Uncharacterized protein n=1 Tax=Cytospora mali TaxID=578113 RepID=A0A194V412_CYTMA|nr:hypothetical protein VP1G_05950 [Valsa mali var. pyri (nom. inval.)]